MKVIKLRWLLPALLGTILYGCDTVNTPSTDIAIENSHTVLSSSDNSDIPIFLAEYEETDINGNLIKFAGRFVNKNTEGDVIRTTFTYSVTNDGTTSQANKFFLETPTCAGDLLSYSPTQNASMEPGGISWSSAISNKGTRNYSISFPGDIPLGIITTGLIQGSTSIEEKIIGPCAGVFTLSGSVFIDANEDGIKQATETGIANVVVVIKDSAENSWTTNTSVNGNYSFRVLSGTYTVSSPENLFGGTYLSNTENNLVVVVDDYDVENVNFGYLLDTEKAIRDLTQGQYAESLNTQPTRFWVQQVRHAGKRNSILEEDELDGILSNILNYMPPDPYGLAGAADKQRTALNVLTRPIRTEFEEFLQQLLTAELNIEYGWGSGDPDYDEALRIYSRSLAACVIDETCSFDGSPFSVMSNSVTDQGSVSVSGMMSNSTLFNGTMVLSAFNGTGGIIN